MHPVVYVLDNRIQKRAAVVAALFEEMEAYARPEGAFSALADGSRLYGIQALIYA